VSEADFDAEKLSYFIQHLPSNLTDWTALKTHWKTSIETIAQEIKTGEAAVKFDDENLLLYCEVTPLLRLPERQLQFERFQSKS
jgi:hypothetical protein